MARILLVGTATLDLVYTLDRYPAEDDEVRATGLRLCRGGNAANTAIVLAQLGHDCSFAGVLADRGGAAVILQDFESHHVDVKSCPVVPGQPPTSSIYLSAGHRTIVHHRALPELTALQFSAVDLAPYDWVHFEGRNVPELLHMLARVRQALPQARVSLEIEKPRPAIESALDMADVLIFSRAYAKHLGHDEAPGFLTEMRDSVPRANLVVAWGDLGAYCLPPGGDLLHSPAFPPQSVVDTLGAGDTFNAALIDNFSRGEDPSVALEASCRLAGKKCGIYGLMMSGA